jgi:hypothetical protein
MINDDFPSNYRRLAFVAVLNTMLKHMPIGIFRQEQIDKIIITKRTFQTRIQLIAAITYFFQTKEGLSPSLMKYIDSIYVDILNSHVHPLLHAAVLRSISNFPRININRWRVETKYRDILKNIMNSNLINSDHMRRTGYFKKMVYNLFFNLQLYQVWSVWYPRPSDSEILKNYVPIVNGSGQIPILGYCSRRLQYILEMFPRINDQPEDMKKALLQKISRIPYSEKDLPITTLKPFDEIAENGIINDPNRIEYLPILSPLQNLDMFTTKVKDPPSIKIELSPPEIEFTAGPQTASFYIKNEANASSKSFFIQISDPSAFEVSPSYGILGPSESIIINVKFIPKEIAVVLNARVNEYLCIRSKFGIPEGRY